MLLPSNKEVIDARDIGHEGASIFFYMLRAAIFLCHQKHTATNNGQKTKIFLNVTPVLYSIFSSTRLSRFFVSSHCKKRDNVVTFWKDNLFLKGVSFMKLVGQLECKMISLIRCMVIGKSSP